MNLHPAPNTYAATQARRTFQHLRGTENFEALIQDHMAREQTSTTLNYIHSWSRIQDQIRARRICMITAARIKQRRLESQLKLEAKINELEVISPLYSVFPLFLNNAILFWVSFQS